MLDVFKDLDNGFNLTQQVKNISFLFSGDTLAWRHSSCLEFIFDNELVKNWESAYGRISYEQLIADINIDFKGNVLEEVACLKYCQLMFNIIYLFEFKNAAGGFADNCETIRKNISYIIDKCGYEFNFNEQKQYFYLTAQNSYLSQIGEMKNDATFKSALYEYNYIDNKNDLNKKRVILKVLADFFEPISLDKRVSEKINGELIIYKPDFFEIIFNCSKAVNEFYIRHNNIDRTCRNFKQFTYDMHTTNPQKLIEWYDKTYMLLLQCFLLQDFLDKEAEWETQFKNEFKGVVIKIRKDKSIILNPVTTL